MNFVGMVSYELKMLFMSLWMVVYLLLEESFGKLMVV